MSVARAFRSCCWWHLPRVNVWVVARERTGNPNGVRRRSLPHPPAGNPLGSRRGWGGHPAANIASLWNGLCPRSLPCARGGESRNIQTNDNGATEVTPPSEVMNGRKRRGSVSSPRYDPRGTEPIDIAAVPPRRVSGRSKRTAYHAPRQSKLTAEQKATIRSIKDNRSLRELAAEFGVSHETIRALLRKEPPAMAEMG